MMAGVYSSKTLNDNWFEDRNQPEDRKVDRARFLRKDEPCLIGIVGNRAEKLTRMRRKVLAPSYATPDDGFGTMKVSMQHEQIAHPRSRKEVVFNPPKKTEFVNTETIPEVCHEDRRPVNDVPKSGYCSVLNRHDKEEGRRYWDTTTRLSFPQSDEEKAAALQRSEALLKKEAGVRGGGDKPPMEGSLVGENPKLCNIPVQRSWMAVPDPGLREYTKNGPMTVAIPKIDNELSLPLGEGAQKKVREALEARGGRLGRRASAITKGGEKVPAEGPGASGISIFLDHDEQ